MVGDLPGGDWGARARAGAGLEAVEVGVDGQGFALVVSLERHGLEEVRDVGNFCQFVTAAGIDEDTGGRGGRFSQAP
jgi:gamma-glutamylcysteine synthetase